jgi:UMF1 family MFS transporter
MFKLPKLTKKERSWVLYDVANSAFVLTVITVLFPIYHKAVESSPENAGQYFAFLTAGIALVVAVLSPIFGSLANYKGNKKKFFKIFLGIGIAGGVGIAIPGLEWLVLMGIFAISSIGYNLTNVLYDSFLIDVTSEDKFDEISSQGFAWGYIGSMIPFFIAIIPFFLVTLNIIDDSFYQLAISYAFIVTVIWWFFYSLPLLKDVDQEYEVEFTDRPVGDALSNLMATFKDIRRYKHIFIFMIAYLLYIDVVNTVIRLATTIGSELNVGDPVLLGVVILVQFIAFPCAILYGRMTKKFGGKVMIYYGIFIYGITIGVVSLISEPGDAWLMWVVAVLVGSAQGGIQSISRSYFARMLPIEKANEFFGFFSVFGKFSGIFSPFLLGVLMGYVDANIAILVLFGPLLLGAIILGFVRLPNETKEIHPSE